MTNQSPYGWIPKIEEVWKYENHNNSLSGHSWQEPVKIIGYEVSGGGWMPTTHRTERAANKELLSRMDIMKEREDTGRNPYTGLEVKL